MAIFENKLSAAEKIEYRELKDYFKTRNLEFKQGLLSGVTIAYCDHNGGNFRRVAIAYCNSLDKFNKKRGKFEALKRLEDNQYILLPKYIGIQYETILAMI